MTTPLSTYLDRLVADARSARDATFNTLDAINRQTSAASAEIRQRAQQFIAEHSRPDAPTDDRDARFDPEDEWDLPPREQPAPAARPDVSEDAEDYPETWLR